MDDFSDDDFDTLNANVLQELEDNAIQFTQAQKPYPTDSQALATNQAPTPLFLQSRPDNVVHNVEDEDLDDAVVVIEDDGPKLGPNGPSQPELDSGSLLPELAHHQQSSRDAAWHRHSVTMAPASHFHTQSVDPANWSTASLSIKMGSRAFQQGSTQNRGFLASQIARPPPPAPLPRVSPSTQSRFQMSQMPPPLARPAPSVHYGHQTSQAPPPLPRPAPSTQFRHQMSQAPPPFPRPAPSIQYGYQVSQAPPPLPRPAPLIESRYQTSQALRQNGAPSPDIAAMQAQILDLKSKLTTKEGEISIVRRRLEISRQDHERELQTIKTATAEQLAKHERAAQAARAAQESAVTELEFTRRDLKEEFARAKRGSQDVPRTPKKNPAAKTWGVSDGFEDVEVAVSPSKGKRAKAAGPVANSIVEPPAKILRTPMKNKRKRAPDSPAMPLETHSDVVMVDAGSVTTDDLFGLKPSPTARKFGLFDHMGAILNHKSSRGRPLTFEFLSNYELPSSPGRSLASILLEKLGSADDPNDPKQLPVQFCLEVIRLWDACRKEKDLVEDKERLLVPIAEFVSLIALVLQLQTMALAPYIAPSLLPVAMDSCYEVAIPRFNNSNSNPGDPKDEDFIQLREHIDTTKILTLLHLTAVGCQWSDSVAGSFTSSAADFWNSVHVQFILMLLNRKQPVGDFVATLGLLDTSVLPDSIGPIDPEKSREYVAQVLVDRISIHLVETPPRWDIDELQLREVRHAILQTLSAFTRSPFGLARLAKHELLIPRLVTFLSSCIDGLYDGDMQYSSAGEDGATLWLQTLVAQTVLLLHGLIMSPSSDGPIDMSAKLSKTPGGSQKYLLSLSRLNFADDLVPESTAELAHELLEMAVTSEAGEELGEFFSG